MLHRVSTRLNIAAINCLLLAAPMGMIGTLWARMLLFLELLRLMLKCGSRILMPREFFVPRSERVGLTFLRLRPYPFPLDLEHWKLSDLPGIIGCLSVELMSMAPNVEFLSLLLRLVEARNPLGIHVLLPLPMATRNGRLEHPPMQLMKCGIRCLMQNLPRTMRFTVTFSVLLALGRGPSYLLVNPAPLVQLGEMAMIPRFPHCVLATKRVLGAWAAGMPVFYTTRQSVPY